MITFTVVQRYANPNAGGPYTVFTTTDYSRAFDAVASAARAMAASAGAAVARLQDEGLYLTSLRSYEVLIPARRWCDEPQTIGTVVIECSDLAAWFALCAAQGTCFPSQTAVAA